jgi:adenine/guanine phosphoribosyltransferase-like PRPP-binding protein
MHTQSGIAEKYAEACVRHHMTITEAEMLSRELADRIRPLVQSDLEQGRVTVVGIANGGLMIARIVADSLSAPMEIIGIRRSGSSLKRALSRFKSFVRITAWALEVPFIRPILAPMIDNMNRLQKSDNDPFGGVDDRQHSLFGGKHVILIDDCIESGQTVALARRMVTEAGASAVTTGVITFFRLENDPAKADQFSPMVYINGRTQHHYPWSQNNAEYDDFLSWLGTRGIKPWV